MSDAKTTMPRPRDLVVRAADRARLPEETSKHPMNPRSEIHGFMLSRMVGLKRVGLNWIRIPPGKESFIYHVHHTEEELMYVLSGRGVAEIGDEEIEIGPGDFLGFPPRTLAHHLRNTGSEDLVYLAGGESVDVEVGDFPREGKRLVRIGPEAHVYPIHGASFWPEPPATTKR